MRIAPLALAFALALAVAACARTAPVLVLDDVPVTPSSGRPLAAGQVRTAIVAAGTSLGWRVVDTGPGRLEGTLSLRNHMAVVDIPYSTRSYSIRLKRSENLYEADGRIHSNYNGWVQHLDRAIRTELARM